MKWIVVLVVFMAFGLGYGLGRYTTEPVEVVDDEESYDEKKAPICPPCENESSNGSGSKKFSEAGRDQLEGETFSQENENAKADDANDDVNPEYRDFQEFHDSFQIQARDFFIEKLSMTEEQFEAYESIKQTYEKEKMEMLNKAHEGKDKAGMFIETPEQGIEMDKLKLRHYENLKAFLGSKKYQAYRKFINDFNDKAAKNVTPGEPFFIIDF